MEQLGHKVEKRVGPGARVGLKVKTFTGVNGPVGGHIGSAIRGVPGAGKGVEKIPGHGAERMPRGANG